MMRRLRLWDIERKLLLRDQFARMVLLMPVIIAVLLRGAVQVLQPLLTSRGIDLTLWHPHLFAFFLALNIPLLYGIVVGFLLLDEADQHIVLALKVTPTSLVRIVWQRVLLASILAAATIAGLAVALGWFHGAELLRIVVASVVSSGYAGVVVLLLATFAPNKLAGFGMIKLAGIVVVLPVAAVLSQHPLRTWAGIIPTYWVIQAIVSPAHWIRDIVISIGLLAGISGWLSWRFAQQHHTQSEEN